MDYPSPVQTCDGKRLDDTRASRPQNENETEVGPYGMKEATAKSVNTYFVQLISDIGICPVTEMADKMGVERADGKKMHRGPVDRRSARRRCRR